MTEEAMNRNVRLLPAFEATRYLLFWLPVFFLYFSSLLPLEEVLLLEGVYYFGTVVLEVPSGWFSDRVGRRATLLIAMVAQTAGCVLFAATSSLAPFLVAQLFLATGSAFVSGTNYAMLYDSLRAAGRADEVGPRTQSLVSRGFLALAVSSLIGGLLGGFDLRIAYAWAAIGSLWALAIAWRMVEPPRAEHERKPRIGVVVAQLRQRPLLWVFAFAVAMTVFNHVPYEFLQPYVEFLAADLGHGDYRPTPAITGVLFCVMMLLSSWSAMRSIALGERLGHAGALLSCLVLQSAIIVGMMLFLHPAVILLMALRSVPMGLSYPVINAIVQPRIDGSVRATYLSVQSLAGNLAFSATLFVASSAVGGIERLSVELMQRVLLAYAIGAGIVLAALAATAAWLRRP